MKFGITLRYWPGTSPGPNELKNPRGMSIDKDGTMNGYDKELIKIAVENTAIPIIGAGGAGTFDHLKEAFLETDVSALACGSLFNFGDNNPIRAKAFLTNYSIPFKVI